MSAPHATPDGPGSDLLTVRIGEQWFGLAVAAVRDVLGPRPLATVPLAPPAVAGSLNLRGRIVTAIDPRACLGLPGAPAPRTASAVVIERNGDAYALLVDALGGVVSPSDEPLEDVPVTVSERWRDICHGVCRCDDRLVVALDVDRLLDLTRTTEPWSMRGDATASEPRARR